MNKGSQNNPWKEAIVGEINDVGDLNIVIPHDNKESIPKDYKFIPVHFVFDLKYDGRRRARLVTEGHLTLPDISEEYSGVKSIEHLRHIKIRMLIVSIN